MRARLASQADCILLAAMSYALIQDEGHRNPMTVAELEQRLCGWLESGDYDAVIFERDLQPVAYALYRLEPNSDVYLRQFFVTREYRCQGIGRAAIELLFREIWPAGTRVAVEVLAHNQVGRRFWSALGFEDYSLTLERTSTIAPRLEERRALID